MVGTGVTVYSQDEILGGKLAEYLGRHPDRERVLSRKKRVTLYVTDKTPEFQKRAVEWFGSKVRLQVVDLLSSPT